VEFIDLENSIAFSEEKNLCVSKNMRVEPNKIDKCNFNDKYSSKTGEINYLF